MAVRHYNREPLSERQFKSGVFDIDYADVEVREMPKDNIKLSAAEKERRLREEEKDERQSRTARLKEAMGKSDGDGVRKLSTRFGSFSGAGVVDASDVREGGGSSATIKVTAEQKEELRQKRIKADHLEEGDEISLGSLNWDKPEEI